jgi:hypothetical protein
MRELWEVAGPPVFRENAEFFVAFQVSRTDVSSSSMQDDLGNINMNGLLVPTELVSVHILHVQTL